MMTNVDARFFKTLSASFKRHDSATSPTVVCANIQLAPNRSRVNARASAGLVTSSSRSLDGCSDPSTDLTKLGESLDTETKLEVSEIVASFCIGMV